MPTPIDSLKPGDWIQVVAISLPFIAIRRLDGRTRSIDARRWDVQRLSKAYVNAYRDAGETPTRARKTKPVVEQPDPRTCERCGERCVQ